MNAIQSYNSSCSEGHYFVGNQTPLLSQCSSFLVQHLPIDKTSVPKTLLEVSPKGAGLVSNVLVAFKAFLTESSSERTGAAIWAHLKANDII